MDWMGGREFLIDLILPRHKSVISLRPILCLDLIMRGSDRLSLRDHLRKREVELDILRRRRSLLHRFAIHGHYIGPLLRRDVGRRSIGDRCSCL